MFRRFADRCYRLVRRPWRLATAAALLALTGLALSVPGRHLWAEHHFRAARDALEHYRPAEALAHLRPCLEVWPHSAAVHLLTAQAARRAGDLDGAWAHLVACEEAQGRRTPESALERDLIRAQRGEVNAVVGRCRARLDRGHPQAALILEALAAGYLRRYRLDEADYCLRQLLERQPDNLIAYLQRGWLMELHEELREAADCYRKVLTLDKDRDDARQRLAGVLVANNEPAEAAGYLESFVARQPDNLQARVLLARCRHMLGQPQQAARLLDDILAVDPTFAPALSARAQVALQFGRPAEAVGWLQQAVAQMPGDYPAHFMLFQALTQSGQTSAAHREEGRMKACRADLDRMREIIQKKITRSPRDPDLRHEVGRILLQGGSVREGLRWLRDALAIDPDHQPTHRLLAEYYDHLGDVGRAEQHRRCLH
jgi:predicted Zn-dependent protease